MVLHCEYREKKGRKEKKKKPALLCLGRYQDQGEYQLTYAFSGTGTIFRAQSEIITRLASQPTRRRDSVLVQMIFTLPTLLYRATCSLEGSRVRRLKILFSVVAGTLSFLPSFLPCEVVVGWALLGRKEKSKAKKERISIEWMNGSALC